LGFYTASVVKRIVITHVVLTDIDRQTRDINAVNNHKTRSICGNNAKKLPQILYKYFFGVCC